MKIQIRYTKRIGRGVFALEDIKKGQYVFEFSGELVSDIERARKINCCIQVRPSVWLNPKPGSFGKYINHSCNPNAGIRGTRKIVAMKRIKKGEEVTIDYSTTDDDLLYKMHCRCGNRNCRKVIRSIQFLPKALFKKYKPFISKFLQKSYQSASYP